MTVLWPDVRYALRVLGRRPSFGVVAVILQSGLQKEMVPHADR